jgi:O-acetyl-ADP-ribose deacetylase (regulator of RNase III)
MMTTFTTGDIFAADTEALVNTVNCVGVMGAGLALQFKRSFPANFKAYEDACRRREVRPGRMFVFETGALVNPKYIVNFPTKRHWRDKSRMQDIEAGLVALVDEIKRANIRSVAIPPLGCGLGGLDWMQVRARIEEALCGLPDLRAVIYNPKEPSAPQDRRGAGRSAQKGHSPD